MGETEKLKRNFNARFICICIFLSHFEICIWFAQFTVYLQVLLGLLKDYQGYFSILWRIFMKILIDPAPKLLQASEVAMAVVCFN